MVRQAYRCWAEVDLDALRGNLAWIRHRIGPSARILTVVKADAYGHGLKETAASLMQAGTDVFGVANLAEALAIRRVGRGWPILILGATLPWEMEGAIEHGIMVTVSSHDEALELSEIASRLEKTVRCQLKIDTGMSRLGVSTEEAAALANEISGLPSVRLTGVYTHFASAEEDARFSSLQSRRFRAVVEKLRALGLEMDYVHASNSAGVLSNADDGCNTVRPGLLVYGVVPRGKRMRASDAAKALRPALSWKCRVGLLKGLPKGARISYGGIFAAPRPMRVAILTAGYGDGYLRSGSNRAFVLIGGRRCRILGRITMDQMVADVSSLPQVEVGDEAVLIGAQGGERISADDVAGWCETIPWEVLTNISYRVPRIYLGSQAA